MKRIVAIVAVMLALQACAGKSADTAQSIIERGRYVTLIGGCNDCHTQDYAFKDGQIEEKDWLKGNTVGWQGPWGTTYPSNLRIYFQKTSEEDWMRTARTATFRPPMPWFTLRHISDDDLRAVYRFVNSLGAAGNPAPAYLSPGADSPAPKFDFVLPAGPPAASPAPGG